MDSLLRLCCFWLKGNFDYCLALYSRLSFMNKWDMHLRDHITFVYDMHPMHLGSGLNCVLPEELWEKANHVDSDIALQLQITKKSS